MKKQIFLSSFILLLCMFVYNNSTAQKNVVKLGLGSLIVHQNINVKYERAFGDNHSFQLSFIYDIPNSPWYIKPFNNQLPNNIKFGGIHFVPEYRYYFGKKGSPRGFYGGAYAKIGRTKSFIEDVKLTNKKIPTELFLKTNHISLGLNIGAQWIINEHFTIDWNIGGIGFSQWSSRAGFSSEEPLVYSKDQLIMEINEEITKIDNSFARNQLYDLLEKMEPVIKDFETDSYESIKVKSWNTDFRFGLSLGYAF